MRSPLTTVVMALGLASPGCGSDEPVRGAMTALDGGSVMPMVASDSAALRDTGAAVPHLDDPKDDADVPPVVDAGGSHEPVDAAVAPSSDAGPLPPIGGQCETDTDCADGLKCFSSLTPSPGYGAQTIPGGYCSIDCSTGANCGARGLEPHCFQRPGLLESYCIAGCEWGTAVADKCGGRGDEQACVWAGQATGGVCVPNCSRDSACGAGLTCFPGNGMCVPGAAATDTIGIGCEPGHNCAGYCLLSDRNGEGLCSATCTVGANPCGAEPNNLCAPRGAAGRVGDQGNCLAACKSDADCAEDRGECVYSGFGSESDRRGLCTPLRTPALLGTQFLSVTEFERTSLPSGVTAVYATAPVDGAVGMLSATEDAVCFRGEVPVLPDAVWAALTFQFESVVPPASYDASNHTRLAFGVTSSPGEFVLMNARLATHPNLPYEPSAGGVRLAYGSGGSHDTEFSEMSRESYPGYSPDDPPWDPSQLSSVTFYTSVDGGPFELCIERLALD